MNDELWARPELPEFTGKPDELHVGHYTQEVWRVVE